ncbi:GYF domain-containing protein [Fontisphaera persica]|uniref:GYF domain-containing protein n=1 Tax=Fontisphaera persica TaxID=2974023 RepID=UPI0024C060E7|nr:GYF domain-containing protein [Fontisphaera persica]WCJ58041.1 GYF domain-containing protein [Fontisphaera persica]
METTRYYVRGADQREYGPVDASVIRRWLEEGRLNHASLLRREDSSQWQALGTWPDWQDVVPPPPVVVAPLPSTTATVPTPPANKPRLSALAVGSLVAGLLTPCTLGLSGLAGLVMAIMALVRFQRHPGRWQGRGLAIGGLCVSAALGMLMLILLLGVALPNFQKARETSQRNACLNHLRQLDAAKEQWFRENKKRNTDAPTWDDLVGPGKYFQQKPVCPAGGTYTLGDMMTEPACSIPKHSLQYPMTRRPPR